MMQFWKRNAAKLKFAAFAMLILLTTSGCADLRYPELFTYRAYGSPYGGNTEFYSSYGSQSYPGDIEQPPPAYSNGFGRGNYASPQLSSNSQQVFTPSSTSSHRRVSIEPDVKAKVGLPEDDENRARSPAAGRAGADESAAAGEAAGDAAGEAAGGDGLGELLGLLF